MIHEHIIDASPSIKIHITPKICSESGFVIWELAVIRFVRNMHNGPRRWYINQSKGEKFQWLVGLV